MLDSNNQFEKYFSLNNLNNRKEQGYNVLNARESEILNPPKNETFHNIYI